MRGKKGGEKRRLDLSVGGIFQKQANAPGRTFSGPPRRRKNPRGVGGGDHAKKDLEALKTLQEKKKAFSNAKRKGTLSAQKKDTPGKEKEATALRCSKTAGTRSRPGGGGTIGEGEIRARP